MDAPLALDLGSGPGFSTELIALICRPRTLIGLDSSEQFLRAARARVPGALFETHDVSVVPFPTPPPDMIYARLVLAHLPDPSSIVDRWRQQLATGGVFLSEELDDIEAPAGALRDYDRLSADIVQRGGGVMYAGPLLDHLGGRGVRVVATAALAARIYSFNVRLWRVHGDSGVPTERLVELEQGLAELAGTQDGRTVTWVVRQTVVRG